MKIMFRFQDIPLFFENPYLFIEDGWQVDVYVSGSVPSIYFFKDIELFGRVIFEFVCNNYVYYLNNGTTLLTIYPSTSKTLTATLEDYHSGKFIYNFNELLGSMFWYVYKNDDTEELLSQEIILNIRRRHDCYLMIITELQNVTKDLFIIKDLVNIIEKYI